MFTATGIYAIENIWSGAAYIGGTKRGFQNRWSTHRMLLNMGNHHSVVLQQDWTTHGPGWFKFIPLEEVPPNEPTAPHEQRWIDYLKSQGHACYNIIPARERPLTSHHAWVDLNPLDVVYTITEVAQYMLVAKSTVRRMIQDGKLEAFRAGKNYRVTQAAIDHVIGSSSELKDDSTG